MYLVYFFKDIRWCRKESGKFQILSFQDPPRTDVVKRSIDGCTVMQSSVLFYRVSQNDTALEIMCESGWGYPCGAKGISAKLSIPTTDTQPGNLCFSIYLKFYAELKFINSNLLYKHYM